MDQLIEVYIQDTFHPDLVDVIKEAFNIFDVFEYPDQELAFLDCLMIQMEQSTQDTQDKFLGILNNQLDNILEAHLIELTSEVNLKQKVEILNALFMIQDLLDYSDIVDILETELDSAEKISAILSQHCVLSETVIFSLIENVSDITIDLLKKFVSIKEIDNNKVFIPHTELQKDIIKNLRLFKKFNTSNETPLGLLLLESEVLLGQPFKNYIQFIGEKFNSSNYEQIAIDFFSLTLLSSDGFENSLTVFREFNNQLLQNIFIISKVDVFFVKLVGDFNKFKDANAAKKDTQ